MLPITQLIQLLTIAECLLFSCDKHRPVRRILFDKVPTELVYKDNEIISWGLACQYHRHNDVKKHFKIDPNLFTGILAQHKSIREVERCKHISDYLHYFCSDIVNQIRRTKDVTSQQFNTKWYLMKPGCWDEKTRGDFQMLAVDVLTKLLPHSNVVVDMTESQASCEYIYGGQAQHCKRGVLGYHL